MALSPVFACIEEGYVACSQVLFNEVDKGRKSVICGQFVAIGGSKGFVRNFFVMVAFAQIRCGRYVLDPCAETGIFLLIPRGQRRSMRMRKPSASTGFS